ncbi:MAG: hypothetical protein SPL51_06125, partial [Lachnospiraceae bacterium]|nr:hypothetical protein [Lachnospiraceae bacterium]
MEFSVLKVIVAFLLISIDIVVSPDKKANLDLLPDFIGYAILIYQFYKFRKDNSENDSLKVAAKQGMITAAITFVVSYVAYILDMYGILYKINANITVMLSAVLELAFLLNIFMFNVPGGKVKIDCITIFPEMFTPMKQSIMGRAQSKGLMEFNTVYLRDFAINDYGQVDDVPYGGEPGMVIRPEPLANAIRSTGVKEDGGKVIYLTADGVPFTHKMAKELSKE